MMFAVKRVFTDDYSTQKIALRKPLLHGPLKTNEERMDLIFGFRCSFHSMDWFTFEHYVNTHIRKLQVVV